MATKLRELGKTCAVWLENDTKLDKQLRYADKKHIPYCIILGENEIKNNTITIKDMQKNKQQTKSLEEFFNTLS